ncbi:MAG: enoyl-CoA hydratase-related protein [Ilumatobacter sp.]|nr:enoyl-CoA hydratase/isomerase family protein [bacterium]MDG1264972.1 enoyl-CoA hydratase-related protein [Ilumatobacter sp.]
MEQLVTVGLNADIATITMDSQHNRNALSMQLLAELHTGLDAAEMAGARAIVLRHEGPAFCAGADLKERSDGAPDVSPFVSVLERLMDSECPTIAAVDGAVRAGGIGLMASCDLVVVNSATTFALTEVRIGVAAAIISVPILLRVPASRIAAAMLTGEVFGAAEARSIGLITHVSDDVTGTVATLVDDIRAGAPRAVRETKALLRRVPTLTRDVAFTEMAALSNRLFDGPDARIGMQAFRDKRRPNWNQSDT